MLGPYAGVPYGMVQPGPDNQEQSWMAGYDYSIINVTGVSHIHACTKTGLMVNVNSGTVNVTAFSQISFFLI